MCQMRVFNDSLVMQRSVDSIIASVEADANEHYVVQDNAFHHEDEPQNNQDLAQNNNTNSHPF